MTSSAPRSLYIHVPFCARRCFYCDFAVEANRQPPTEAWIAAVASEIALTAVARGWSDPLELDTLYVGGGTPSLLGAGAMATLRAALAPFATLREGAEWTCEANPESFTGEIAHGWRDAGVNRLSLGAQSFDPKVLRWMGRLHGSDGPGAAMAAAREASFADVSIDLIFGLPARLGRDWAADLDRAIDLAPDHVSLYGLTAEAGAPLGRRLREGKEVLADEDTYADEFLLAHERLTDAGFEHYEVSNFARPGHRSKHNLVYWTGEPYAALGPGAHAFDPPVRRWNVRSWSDYQTALSAGSLPIEGEEEVDAEAEELERIWLGLRTDRGYPMAGATDRQKALVEWWTRGKLARWSGPVVRLTPEGWLLLDRLAIELQGVGARADRAERIDVPEALVQISGNSNPSSG